MKTTVTVFTPTCHECSPGERVRETIRVRKGRSVDTTRVLNLKFTLASRPPEPQVTETRSLAMGSRGKLGVGTEEGVLYN